MYSYIYTYIYIYVIGGGRLKSCSSWGLWVALLV